MEDRRRGKNSLVRIAVPFLLVSQVCCQLNSVFEEQSVCQSCVTPPPYPCHLEGYDCDSAHVEFTISKDSGCSVLSCPRGTLFADAVAVSSIACSPDGAWYYSDADGDAILVSGVVCAGQCTNCSMPPMPDEKLFPPPKGFVYEQPWVDLTKDCATLACHEGELVGFRECEKTLSNALHCSGDSTLGWTSNGLSYHSAACKIPCNNCPLLPGYSDHPSAVSLHYPVSFDLNNYQCATLIGNCPFGYALRITFKNGTETIVAPGNVHSMQWSCLGGIWTVTFKDDFGNIHTEDIVNQECFTGVCISCDYPHLTRGLSAHIGWNTTTGCMYHDISGCPNGSQYRARGQNFGIGINRIHCANYNAMAPQSAWYHAGHSGPMVFFRVDDAIGCNTK